jgi:hypothetical protein
MKPHKWAKEIKAWADGAEIEQRYIGSATSTYQIYIDWHTTNDLHWDNPSWEYRIKPQPKENYLYVYRTSTNGQIEYRIYHDKDAGGALLGKIKLEQDE